MNANNSARAIKYNEEIIHAIYFKNKEDKKKNVKKDEDELLSQYESHMKYVLGIDDSNLLAKQLSQLPQYKDQQYLQLNASCCSKQSMVTNFSKKYG